MKQPGGCVVPRRPRLLGHPGAAAGADGGNGNLAHVVSRTSMVEGTTDPKSIAGGRDLTCWRDSSDHSPSWEASAQQTNMMLVASSLNHQADSMRMSSTGCATMLLHRDTSCRERSSPVELQLNFTVLLKQAQEGDTMAFGVIFEHFAQRLFRSLYAHCGDVNLAEEIASSTWVRAVERLTSFQLPTSNAPTAEVAFAAWLYRIGRNLLIDTYRRSGPVTLLLEEAVVDDVRVDEHILATETQQELRAALMQLTPEQRDVIIMRFIEERKTAEVAHITGRTEGAVRALQHRGLAALARLLTKKHGTQELYE